MFREHIFTGPMSEGPPKDSDVPYGYYAMAEGKLLIGPLKEKHDKLMQTRMAYSNCEKDMCMDCMHYRWYEDNECSKFSCHVEMTEEKECFKQRRTV